MPNLKTLNHFHFLTSNSNVFFKGLGDGLNLFEFFKNKFCYILFNLIHRNMNIASERVLFDQLIHPPTLGEIEYGPCLFMVT